MRVLFEWMSNISRGKKIQRERERDCVCEYVHFIATSSTIYRRNTKGRHSHTCVYICISIFMDEYTSIHLYTHVHTWYMYAIYIHIYIYIPWNDDITYIYRRYAKKRYALFSRVYLCSRANLDRWLWFIACKYRFIYEHIRVTRVSTHTQHTYIFHIYI